jgi:predicted transglutaminase-like cysteine proteinase
VHLAIKICTIAVTLFAAVTASILGPVAIVMLVVPGRLPTYTMSNFGHQPPGLQMVVEASKSDMSARPLTIARRSDPEFQQVIFNTRPDAPTEFLVASLNAVTNPTNAFRAAVTSLPLAPHFVGRPHDADINRITYDIPTLAPMGFVYFCMRYPQDCNAGKSSLQPELLTEVRKAELVAVNRDVNHDITPHKKMANDGSSDEWLVSPRDGDCKDYAITKRHTLLARGWPAHSLLLAEVVIPSGEHHLVLVVRTREKDFVLDNLNENILPVSQTPYRWVRAQTTNNPRFWATINVAGATRIAMNAH